MAQIKTLLDDPNFLEFYVTAKKSTYASGLEPTILAADGKQYVFRDTRWPQWYYRDVYYGDNPFFGRETIEQRTNTECPLWIPVAQMSYDGFASGNEDQVKKIFAFLKKMLQQVTVRSIFRGPPIPRKMGSIEEDGLTYSYQWFRRETEPFHVHGKEYILFRPMSATGWYVLNFQFCCLV